MENTKNKPKDVSSFLHLLSLSEGAQWLHLCIRHEGTASYLTEQIKLDDLVVQALLDEDTRSRIRVRPDGIMILLKAMHLRGEEMARPEDMVSIRLWIAPKIIITTREADVDPIVAIATRLQDGTGPLTVGEFLVELIDEHLNEVEEQVELLEDDVSKMGVLVAQNMTEIVCPNIAGTDIRISGFLRHLRPQRAVFETLANLKHDLLGDRERAQLDDSHNRLLRFLETLQELRDRIEILNDQVTRIQDRQLNRISYGFAATATIFLPLSFLAGLFGVNFAGIPFANEPLAFMVFTSVCVVIAILVFTIFRWRRWL